MEMKWEGWLRKEGSDTQIYVSGADQRLDLAEEVHSKLLDLMSAVMRQIESRTKLGITIEENHGQKPGQKT